MEQPSGTMDEIPGLSQSFTIDEWRTHWLHAVECTTGHAVARLDNMPFLVENRIGQGRVFFVTGLNMADSSADKRGAEPFLYANTLYRFLHELKKNTGDGISFAPWNGIEYVYNERDDGTGLLLVMNHGDGDYRRDATMRNPRGYAHARVLAEGSWESWRAGGTVSFARTGGTVTWSFSLPAKHFVVFAFGAASPESPDDTTCDQPANRWCREKPIACGKSSQDCN